MTRSGYQLHQLRGREIEPWMDAIGELRIAVFREFPYLYDGDLAYEREYLKTYLNSTESLVVVVEAEGRAVGVTTCLPLRDECAEFQAPFIDQNWDIGTICYFGESLLMPEWRGVGLGKEFFEHREAHARDLGLKHCAFCAVDRPINHPQRPEDYRPLDEFWSSREFVKQPKLQAVFHWKETGESEETPKTLTFWMKSCTD
jgi:GNAT superfamily N-acetyltransferase